MRILRQLPLLAALVVALPAGALGAADAAPASDSAPAPDAAPLAVLRLEPYRRSVAVRVSANGSSGLMAFDTAAGHTVVSPEFAAAGGCTPWGNLGGFTMTGTRLDMARCDGFRFEADGEPLVAPVAGVMQVAPLLAKDAAPIEGLLALDVFAGRVPTAQGTMRFELDSGNGGTLLVSKPYAAVFGLDPAAKGPQPVRIPVAEGIVAEGLAFTPDMNIDGNLGMPFLKDWIVTLDLAAGRMWLRRNEAAPPPDMGVPPAGPKS